MESVYFVFVFLNGLTFSMHIRIYIQALNVVHRYGFDPHILPDTAARGVEYVARHQGLLAHGYHIIAVVGGVMDKYQSRIARLVA